MAQLVARLDDQMMAEVDGLVADGVVGSRTEAVPRGLEHLVDQHQRQRRVQTTIVDAHRAPAAGPDELAGLDAATRALVDEEPW